MYSYIVLGALLYFAVGLILFIPSLAIYPAIGSNPLFIFVTVATWPLQLPDNVVHLADVLF